MVYLLAFHASAYLAYLPFTPQDTNSEPLPLIAIALGVPVAFAVVVSAFDILLDLMLLTPALLH